MPAAPYTNGHTAPARDMTGVPSTWLRFLYRMIVLERGRMYTLVLNVPENPQDEPTWAIMGEGRTENGKRVAK
jgi:hypothetical protein